MKAQSPAFQFYPKDWLSDPEVVRMTLEERGAYMQLLCYCWLEGGIPNDVDELAKLCGVTRRRMQKLWKTLGPRFEFDGKTAEVLRNPRLERERKAQNEHRERRREAGRRGAASRWGKRTKRPAPAEPAGVVHNGNAIDLPLANDGSPSPTPVRTPPTPPAARAAPAESPAPDQRGELRSASEGSRDPVVAIQDALGQVGVATRVHVRRFRLARLLHDLELGPDDVPRLMGVARSKGARSPAAWVAAAIDRGEARSLLADVKEARKVASSARHPRRGPVPDSEVYAVTETSVREVLDELPLLKAVGGSS